MSHELGGEPRSSSPFSSDRSSVGPRGQRREIEDGMYVLRSLEKPALDSVLTRVAVYKKDKAFRRYASGIKQALALFDSAQQDWADYISFLGRLLKVRSHNLPQIVTGF